MSHSRQRSNWGWGYADESPAPAALKRAQAALFPTNPGTALDEPDWKAIVQNLRKPRFRILRDAETERLIEICSEDALDRVRHCYGKVRITVFGIPCISVVFSVWPTLNKRKILFFISPLYMMHFCTHSTSEKLIFFFSLLAYNQKKIRPAYILKIGVWKLI
jgi:hypothetical protein